MTRRENRTSAPLWLEFSGLPELLSKKCKGGSGWPLFKKIVELDCERNSLPGTVEISLDEMYQRCGVAPDAARRTAAVFRKLQLTASFLPDNDEEAALFRVITPLLTPISAADIRLANPHLFEEAVEYFRYYDDCPMEGDDDLPANDPNLKETIDLYFDVIGLKMNAFILDELRMLPQRFQMKEIHSVFRTARKNEIRSLHWVMQELVRRRAKSGPPPQIAEKPLFIGSPQDDKFEF